VLSVGVLLLSALPARAQEPASCRFLCAPAFKVEPTITFTNFFDSPRTLQDDGAVTRAPRETEFEVILSLDLPTRVSWLEFTFEAIFLPFDPESTPELEFETNLVWLPAKRTRGWLSSHFDIVDKFSPAERPSTDRRAYTHKLNLSSTRAWRSSTGSEKGAAWRGTRRVLDYVATGLPKAGTLIDGRRFLDAASPWSFSLVFVLPIAPL
jgi:hypothetical protein